MTETGRGPPFAPNVISQVKKAKFAILDVVMEKTSAEEALEKLDFMKYVSCINIPKPFF